MDGLENIETPLVQPVAPVAVQSSAPETQPYANGGETEGSKSKAILGQGFDIVQSVFLGFLMFKVIYSTWSARRQMIYQKQI